MAGSDTVPEQLVKDMASGTRLRGISLTGLPPGPLTSFPLAPIQSQP